ncbi:hypothetical protein UJ101_00622 [Flavobacteriaceae bacterium UJ101]|nr:hypothetical protein UJ101_00622 [Flavobacteriaceae bacterium UJ101]
MKKIIYSIFLTSVIFSCDVDESHDTKNPTDVPGETLFANAQKELVDQMVNTNVNTNIFRLFSQYWTQTTYTDESNYDITTRTVPDNHWEALYVDVIKDLSAARTAIEASATATDTADDIAVRTNKLAIISLIEAYTYQILIDTFGNIPYTEALDINNVTPVYDDAKTIYQELITKIDTALDDLDESTGSFGNSDLIYSGNVTNWVKFANSLKLKIGMTLADADNALAKSTVESAVSNLFTSNEDNAALAYLSALPNTNPLYEDLVASGRHDFVVANTIVDVMNTLEDPRRPFYFTATSDGSYIGGTYGASNSYGSNSHPGANMTTPTFEGTILDYVEVEFFLAEAVERGFAVSGTAEEHYNNAITASILYWGGTDAEATDYLAKSEVAYSSATGDYKQKIGTQKWFALYNRGFEGWTEWRRLDYPVLSAPTDGVINEVPKRFTYPIKEQTLNGANYNSASSAIGGDLMTTKLFWDIN